MKTLHRLLVASSCLTATLSAQNVLTDSKFDSIGVSGSSNESFYSVGSGGYLQGWQTTNPDGLLEIWGGGTQAATGYYAPSGSNYIAEMNANVQASLFQVVQLDTAATVSVFFQHRGRDATDTAGFSVYDLGAVGVSWDQTNRGTLVYQTYFSSGSSSWRRYSSGGLFTAVAGNRYAFVFDSLSSGPGGESFGNLIADVRFGYEVGSIAAGVIQLTPRAFATSYNGVVVPEPSTYGLALGGLALAWAAARRRGKRG
jgi:hypothetical protein